MVSETFSLIERRIATILSEIGGLKQRIAVLEAEAEKLRETENILRSLHGIDQVPVASANVIGEFTNPDLQADQASAQVEASAAKAKPVGTLPMSEMVLEALAEAHRLGYTGLNPSAMTTYVREHYWPGVEVASVGPIAWRMWKRGFLRKEGPSYYRDDRESFYPDRSINLAYDSGQENGPEADVSGPSKGEGVFG